jgi:hypothetical protein
MTQALRSTGLPTLIPNLDGVTDSGALIEYQTPNAAAAGRVLATATVTVGGSITNTNTAAITLTSVVFAAPITVQYTVITGDSLQSVAEGLASLINAQATLQGYDIYATVGVGTTGAEAIITIAWPGPLGNLCTLSKAVTGNITLTLTPAGGALSGGAGAVIPTQNVTVQLGLNTVDLWIDKPVLLDAARVSLLVAALATPVPLK